MARNRSGRSSAVLHAIGAPQSWPTITAVSAPSARTTPTLSATCSTMRYSSTRRGEDERPYPRTSMAAALNPAPATAGNWWRHEYHDSGKPWTNSTSGPSPISATWMRVPSASTTW